MRARPWCLLLTCLLGCASVDDTDPLPEEEGCEGTPGLEVSHGDVPFTDRIPDDTPVLYGWPPQGGAPYSGYDVRYRGLDSIVHVVLTATTPDGEQVGEATYEQRFVCGNAGDNAGWYVSSELHMRFFGYTLEELDGQEVEVHIEVEDPKDRLETGFTGVLTLDDPYGYGAYGR